MYHPDSFSCDICKTKKLPTNHWFVGRVKHIKSKSILIISTFSNRLAKTSENAALCGATCIMQYTSEYLSNLKEKQDEEKAQQRIVDEPKIVTSSLNSYEIDNIDEKDFNSPGLLS